MLLAQYIIIMCTGLINTFSKLLYNVVITSSFNVAAYSAVSQHFHFCANDILASI